MRRDFNVMRDVAQHTRVPPGQRCEQVREFISSINDVPEVCVELDQWGIFILYIIYIFIYIQNFGV